MTGTSNKPRWVITLLRDGQAVTSPLRVLVTERPPPPIPYPPGTRFDLAFHSSDKPSSYYDETVDGVELAYHGSFDHVVETWRLSDVRWLMCSDDPSACKDDVDYYPATLTYGPDIQHRISAQQGGWFVGTTGVTEVVVVSLGAVEEKP